MQKRLPFVGAVLFAAALIAGCAAPASTPAAPAVPAPNVSPSVVPASDAAAGTSDDSIDQEFTALENEQDDIEATVDQPDTPAPTGTTVLTTATTRR